MLTGNLSPHFQNQGLFLSCFLSLTVIFGKSQRTQFLPPKSSPYCRGKVAAERWSLRWWVLILIVVMVRRLILRNLYLCHLYIGIVPGIVTAEQAKSSLVFCMDSSISPKAFWPLLCCSFFSIHSEFLPKGKYIRKHLHGPLTRLCIQFYICNFYCLSEEGT